MTSTRVSNDDAGNVTFRISLPNRAALKPGDFITVELDTDRNQATGCDAGVFGAEYALAVLGHYGASTLGFGRCVGGGWDFSHTPRSFKVRFASRTLVLTVNRAALGASAGFDFRIAASLHRYDGVYYDFAPDSSAAPWSYALSINPLAAKKAPCLRARHHGRCAIRRLP
ncbi:MAG: hypothetical protein WBB74_06025 [Gaiellaceae bacterium]